MSGKHYKRRVSRKRNNADTREFIPSRRRKNAAYFFFTLFCCLTLALVAFAALQVDVSAQKKTDGCEPVLAFKVSQAGEAKLTLLGRDYFANVSFLSPVHDFFKKSEELLFDRVPASLKFAIKGLPRLYSEACRAAAALEEGIIDTLNDW